MGTVDEDYFLYLKICSTCVFYKTKMKHFIKSSRTFADFRLISFSNVISLLEVLFYVCVDAHFF